MFLFNRASTIASTIAFNLNQIKSQILFPVFPYSCPIPLSCTLLINVKIPMVVWYLHFSLHSSHLYQSVPFSLRSASQKSIDKFSRAPSFIIEFINSDLVLANLHQIVFKHGSKNNRNILQEIVINT